VVGRRGREGGVNILDLDLGVFKEFLVVIVVAVVDDDIDVDAEAFLVTEKLLVVEALFVVIRAFFVSVLEALIGRDGLTGELSVKEASLVISFEELSLLVPATNVWGAIEAEPAVTGMASKSPEDESTEESLPFTLNLELELELFTSTFASLLAAAFLPLRFLLSSLLTIAFSLTLLLSLVFVSFLPLVFFSMFSFPLLLLL